LDNTHWKLTLLGETPVAAASGQREPQLILNSDSRRVSGWDGCNQIVGSYELSGKHLTFGQMASTLMACAEGTDTEKALLKALAQVRAWKIEGEELELLDGDGHSMARLEATNAK